jgi:peptide/nickel transport system permease protein
MGPFIVRRLAQSALVLFFISTLLFLLLHYLAPEGPCFTFLGIGADRCFDTLHLGDPLANQYLGWLSGYLHGKFGYTETGQPVSAFLLQRLPATLLLVGVSYIFQQLLALPLGMYAAVRQYSLFDQLLTFLSYVGLSLPAFVLGLTLIYIFPVDLHVLAAARTSDASLPLFASSGWFAALWHNPTYVLGDLVQHLILPAVTLMAIGVAVDSRFMRAAMLEVVHQDYIRTARAKGLRRHSIIFKHALRNALLPVVTNMALYLPALAGSAIVVETVFTWDGIGYAFSYAVWQRDLAPIQAIVLFSAVVVVIANLLADLVYAWIDPRIRYE